MTPKISHFGAYEILHELKSGGMGSVLVARRRGPGAFEQLVAIKTIRAEFSGAAAVRAMFLDEAAILARLSHPNVATVHDFGEQNGTLYMVMEYVAGIPFRDFGELSPPPIVIARGIAEACRGLHAAHELHDLQGTPLGLVHRDISPDNLMLGFDGHVKVIDFGIALVKNRQAPVTEFGMVKGKPPYMSPEQVKNDPMDRRSDVFSLGVVLWEMLTGQGLFDGDSVYAIALAVNEQAIMPPSQICGPLPMGLDAVVMNALDRDQAARTPTAAAMAEQLEQVIASAGEQTLEAWAERELATARRDHRTWIAGIVAGGLGLPAASALGRASGSVTELAPIDRTAPPFGGADRRAQVPAIEGAPPAPVALPVSTHVPPSEHEEVEEEPPRTRSLAVPIAAVMLLLALIAVLVVVMGSRGDKVPDKVALEVDGGAADAHAIVAIDAPADAAVVVDASAPVDATVIVAVPVDAHRIAKDAAIVRPPPQPDAAAEPMPLLMGLGFLTIVADPFANYTLDGGGSRPTPAIKLQVREGEHTIQFLDPKDGHVITTKHVTVVDGKSLTVRP